MNNEKITIAAATTAELDDVLSLLSAVGLPLEGVAEHLDDFLLATDERGQLLGCAGLERYGESALLRSVAVRGALKGAGIGSRLTARTLEHAKETGIKEVVLLTTTAREFFARRFGFADVSRSDYDARFSTSPEWSLPRCSSVAVMKLELR